MTSVVGAFVLSLLDISTKKGSMADRNLMRSSSLSGTTLSLGQFFTGIFAYRTVAVA